MTDKVHPVSPVDKLPDAARDLRNQHVVDRRTKVNGRLVENLPEVRDLLAELLSATHTDWWATHHVRKAFAGYEAPHGRAEVAAYKLALIVLGEQRPEVEE